MSNSIGIYIHIPFCRSKCPYCDFFSMRGDITEYENYVEILNDKIEYWSKETDKTVDSIYIGGGTPSVIGTELLYKIIDKVKKCFNVKDNSEITIEVNPESGKRIDFKKLKDIGLNRVSIGLQSADKDELKSLGRIHSAEDVNNTVELIKNAGIENISLDLMLGIPNQTKESLKNSIDFCADSDIKHISSYILKIEENTYYYKNYKKFNFPDENTTADLYLFALEYLQEKGFIQYEISNFSKVGFESKHNFKYWNLDDYIGIGPAAHSYLNGKRFYYERNIENFKNNIIINDGIGGTKEEYIMLKLRLKSGLNLNKYEEVFGESISKDFLNKVDKYIELGFMEKNNDSISFTPKGFLVSNSILSDLI